MFRTLSALLLFAVPAAAQTTLLISNETGNSISTFNTATAAVGTYHTGIFNPDGLHFAPNGDLYATSFTNGTFHRVTGPNTATTIATGFNGSAGIDRDAAGNYYVANFGAPSGFGSTISKVFPDGSVNHNFVTGLSTPDDVILSPDGTSLYVSEWLSHEITRVNLTTGATTVVVPGTAGLNRPSAMEMDPQGNLYVTNWNTASVSRIAPDGTVTHDFATGLPNSFGLLRDEAGGYFYATTWIEGNLVRFPLTGGPAEVIATGFNGPTFMAIQPVPEPGLLLLVPAAFYLRRVRRIRTASAATP